ncbi:unnamed protein product [Caretta caretta]
MLNNDKCILIEILEELSDKDFENFKWYLKNEADEKKMRVSSLDGADRKETIDKMVSHFGSNQALKKARKVLEAIPRKDLADKLMKKELDWKTSLAEEKGGAEGDHGGGAQGDNRGGAQGDSGGRAQGDSRGGAQGDSGGGAQWDNRGGAQGDNGGGAQKLKERLVAAVLGLGCLGMIAEAIVPLEMCLLIPVGAAVLGYLCDKYRGL